MIDHKIESSSRRENIHIIPIPVHLTCHLPTPLDALRILFRSGFATQHCLQRTMRAPFALIATLSVVSAFVTSPQCSGSRKQCTLAGTRAFLPANMVSAAIEASMAESGVPPTHSEEVAHVAEEDIPSVLPSDVGMDYVPLATLLATGQLAEADQFTRDALIVLAGSKEQGRNFVYFTEVKNIPSTDLATIERLWNRFSKGKFGYTVQKKKWKASKGDFELFCRKVGWTTKDGEVERKKRWFGASEFIYDVKKAPEGHLPLTSALRGTSLLKQLLDHPVWENDDWKKEPAKN